MKFIKHVGKAALAGQFVCAYRDGDRIVLRAETTGGKRINHSFEDQFGKVQVRPLPDARLTDAQFEELQDAWGADQVNPQNAVVTDRALAYLQSRV